jgi:hypothetical protein
MYEDGGSTDMELLYLMEKMIWEYHQSMVDSIREEIEIYDRRKRIALANKHGLA